MSVSNWDLGITVPHKKSKKEKFELSLVWDHKLRSEMYSNLVKVTGVFTEDFKMDLDIAKRVSVLTFGVETKRAAILKQIQECLRILNITDTKTVLRNRIAAIEGGFLTPSQVAELNNKINL